jgi:hypothetical protein
MDATEDVHRLQDELIIESYAMTIADAVARAFETLWERLSRELSDAFNQMAQQIGRARKQQ